MLSEEQTVRLKRKAKRLLIGGLIAFGISAIIIFFLPIFITKWNWISIGSNEPNEIGDTLGGIMGPIVGLLGAGLTFLAFWAQYVANQEQREQFLASLDKQEKDKKEQQFESHFFEMLRLHKENVNEISIYPINNNNSATVEKRQVFKVMVEEFNTLLSFVSLRQKLTSDEFETAYNIFFWGYDEQELEELSAQSQNLIRGYSDDVYGNSISFIPHRGYSGQLGHYFRHLYMMVKFVAKSKEITDYDGKMKYLRMLRAQLSNHEQIMLFYNWLSSGYGGNWENENNRYFTEYKMIHNLWIGELFQNQFIVDAVNGLIDKYNLDQKKSPLFEFQGKDFYLKMNDLP